MLTIIKLITIIIETNLKHFYILIKVLMNFLIF